MIEDRTVELIAKIVVLIRFLPRSINLSLKDSSGACGPLSVLLPTDFLAQISNQISRDG